MYSFRGFVVASNLAILITNYKIALGKIYIERNFINNYLFYFIFIVLKKLLLLSINLFIHIYKSQNPLTH